MTEAAHEVLGAEGGHDGGDGAGPSGGAAGLPPPPAGPPPVHLSAADLKMLHKAMKKQQKKEKRGKKEKKEKHKKKVQTGVCRVAHVESSAGDGVMQGC